MNNVLIVPTLGDFVTELGTPSTVRVFSTEKRSPNAYGSTLRLSLDLTGSPASHPDGNIIVWLHYSISLREVSPLKFLDPKDESVYKQYPQIEEVVTHYLTGAGFVVRPGMYGIDRNLEPIRGSLDCIKWERESDTDGFDHYRWPT